MNHTAPLVTALLLSLAACSAVDSTGPAGPTSSCRPACGWDGSCAAICAPPQAGDYQLSVLSARAIDDTAEPPQFLIYTTDLADAILSAGSDSQVAQLVLSDDSLFIVDLGDDSCVIPPSRGLLTCTTERYEIALKLE